VKELTPEQKQRRAEYARSWRKRNPDKVREHTRRSRIKNKDKIRERQRKWLKDNAESHREYSRQWYLDNKTRVKDLQLQRIHGISLDEYYSLLSDQSGVCAICKSPDPIKGDHFHVDHCHSTNQVRGLLCAHCNVGIGHFKDSHDLLEEAVRYIRRFREDDI